MMFKLKSALTCTFFTLLATNVSAKQFSNQYIQFELPPGWQCSIEGSEWVCQSENQDRRKEAIIILAAKIRGPQDALAEYQAYLKDGKTYQLPGGKMQRSEPKYTNLKTVNEQQWVDALHLASEVPGFYTRYLATVKEDLGVAITFSVTKDLYNAYQGIFDKVIESMRVFRQAKQNLANLRMEGKNQDANFKDEVFAPTDDLVGIGAAGQKKRKTGADNTNDLILFGAVGAVVLLVLMKMRKKKAPAKAKAKKTKES
jgi:LPXTG-motif cell wall-anchored protein